jgi:hypothetical protein
MRAGEDPHGKLRRVPVAAETLREFLETGVVNALCSGVCDPD